MSQAASRLRPYVQLMRVDHWFKNGFMLLGVLVALSHEPSLASWRRLPVLALVLAATCLVASSNYVLNGLLDARTDRFHPEKQHRPAVQDQISMAVGYAEWVGLAVIGIGLSLLINPWFAASAAALATAAGLFGGIFIFRYQLELILFIPLVAGLLGYCVAIGLRPDSPAQRREQLYREKAFIACVTVCVIVLVVFMFTRIPALYDWFNAAPARVDPLWTIGRR